jgi:hypothetical protein
VCAGNIKTMNLCGDSLSDALQILAAEVCLRIGQDMLPKCSPITITPLPEIAEDALCTWLCADVHFFTLFKASDVDSTLVFSHTNEILYHASALAQLAPTCPKDVAFLCQFTFDTLPEGRVPRLLVFDVLTAAPPAQRGERLRSLQHCLPQPLCCLQWIGYARYLSREFLAALPHATTGVVALQIDNLQLNCKMKC